MRSIFTDLRSNYGGKLYLYIDYINSIVTHMSVPDREVLVASSILPHSSSNLMRKYCGWSVQRKKKFIAPLKITKAKEVSNSRCSIRAACEKKSGVVVDSLRFFLCNSRRMY